MAICDEDVDNSLTNTSQQTLNVILVSIIKDFPVLMEKSQLPGTKEKKVLTLYKARVTIATNTGRIMDEKQIAKKITNMKVVVKKKTDANST